MQENETQLVDSNNATERRNRSATEIYNTLKESKQSTNRRGSIMDPQQMEKYISLLNFKDKESDQLLKIALKILKYRTRQNDLGVHELDALMNSTKNIEFFRNMNRRTSNVRHNIHQKCCRVMTYLALSKGSIIFENGDQSDKLYIILTGSVNIFQVKSPEQIEQECEWLRRMSDKAHAAHNNESDKIIRRSAVVVQNIHKEKPVPVRKKNRSSQKISTQKNPYNVIQARKNLFQVKELDDSSQSETSVTTPKLRLERSSEAESEKEEAADDVDENDPKFLLKKQFGDIDPDAVENYDSFFTEGVFHLTYETTLKIGLMFGELGLMNNQPRVRTILCKEDCEFAVITKEDFFDIMDQVREKKRKEKVAFVEKSLFPELPFNPNARVADVLKKLYANNGYKIYQENEDADKMYLIRQGEITLFSKQPVANEDLEALQDFSHLLRKKSADVPKLIPIAVLSAGQYFGEEDLLADRTRTLTAICTSSKAKLFIIHRSDLRRCFDDYPEMRVLLQKKMQMKTKQRTEYKKRALDTLANAVTYEMTSVKKGSAFFNIRKNVTEIFSDDNMKFIKRRMAEQAKSNGASPRADEHSDKNASELLTNRKLDGNPPSMNQVYNIRLSPAESVIEYDNKPNIINPNNDDPKMQFKHFGKKEEDLRTLLLRGVRSDVASWRDQSKKDEISKMTDIVEGNAKTVEQLCKISPPISELFPLLKEFTTKKNEKLQKRIALVKEIERQRKEQGPESLPKIKTADPGNIHVKMMRSKRSVSEAKLRRDKPMDRSSIANMSSINYGNQYGVQTTNRASSTISLNNEMPESKRNSQARSTSQGAKMHFRGNSVADIGFSTAEKHQDIRYYSSVEMLQNRNNLPTKVNMSLNLKSLECIDKSQIESSRILDLKDFMGSDLDRPPESSRTVLEYRESQKRKNNASFVVKYKQMNGYNVSEDDETRRYSQKHSYESRYL